MGGLNEGWADIKKEFNMLLHLNKHCIKTIGYYGLKTR